MIPLSYCTFRPATTSATFGFSISNTAGSPVTPKLPNAATRLPPRDTLIVDMRRESGLYNDFNVHIGVRGSGAGGGTPINTNMWDTTPGSYSVSFWLTPSFDGITMAGLTTAAFYSKWGTGAAAFTVSTGMTIDDYIECPNILRYVFTGTASGLGYRRVAPFWFVNACLTKESGLGKALTGQVALSLLAVQTFDSY